MIRRHIISPVNGTPSDWKIVKASRFVKVEFSMTGRDTVTRRMLLKPSSAFKEPFEVDMSGLELAAKPDDLKVLQIKIVRAGFPVAKAGLRTGDAIVAVDGRPAAELDLDWLTRMFKQAGKSYVLTVQRGEKILRAKLKMRRAV